MLKAGRVVALDTTANLLRAFRAQPAPAHGPARCRRLVRGAAENGGWWSFPFDSFDEVEPLLASMRAAGCGIGDLEIGKPDLEEVFVRVMQGQQERGQLTWLTAVFHPALQGSAALLEGRLADGCGAGTHRAALPADLFPRAGRARQGSTASPTRPS
jgi:hypothetical protein